MNIAPDDLRPYVECDTPIRPFVVQDKCSVYHLELNSNCNLRCALCFPGNKEGYQHANGIMPMDLLETVLDKAHSENPTASVLCYGNSEPFLYPNLPEAIRAVKRRGMRFQLSSNLHVVNRLEEVLSANPDLFIIGLSGWSQEVYSRSFVGGDVERVKRNMYDLGQLNQRYGVRIVVSYHMYRDNLGVELEHMRQFCANLGFAFMPAPARAISVENTIAYLRHKEYERTGQVPVIPIGEDGLDWNKLLPQASAGYLANIPRLLFSPEKAKDHYSRFPVPTRCPISHVGTFVRFDGKVTLCAAMADRRLDIGDYLTMTQDHIESKRLNHPLCRECLRYRFNLYTCLVDANNWR